MTEQGQNTTAGVPKKNNSLLVIGLIALLAVLGAGAYYFLSDKNGENSMSTMKDGNNTGPVATVDGVELSRSEFETNLSQVTQTYAAQGVDTSTAEAQAAIQEEVLNTMINRQLMLAAANSVDLSVSTEEIEASWQQILDNVGGEEGLTTALQEAGVDEATVRQNLEADLLLQKYVNAKAAVDVAEITEEEATTFYNSIKEANPDIDPLTDIMDAVKSQLALQKQQEMVGSLLEQLRAEAEIEINL